MCLSRLRLSTLRKKRYTGTFVRVTVFLIIIEKLSFSQSLLSFAYLGYIQQNFAFDKRFLLMAVQSQCYSTRRDAIGQAAAAPVVAGTILYIPIFLHSHTYSSIFKQEAKEN